MAGERVGATLFSHQPFSCWWVPSFRQTLSSCQQWGPLPGAVSQEESQGREIPFHRGVVDGQCSRVGGCRGVTASKAEEPVDHLVVTEAGCQVEDGGTRVVCVLQEEVGRRSVPGTRPFRLGGRGPRAALGHPPARSGFRAGGVAGVEFLPVRSGAGALEGPWGQRVCPPSRASVCTQRVQHNALLVLPAAEPLTAGTRRRAPLCRRPVRPPRSVGRG